jgi:hypothetical protein
MKNWAYGMDSVNPKPFYPFRQSISNLLSQEQVYLGCFLPTCLRLSPNFCNLYIFTDFMRLRHDFLKDTFPKPSEYFIILQYCKFSSLNKILALIAYSSSPLLIELHSGHCVCTPKLGIMPCIEWEVHKHTLKHNENLEIYPSKSGL